LKKKLKSATPSRMVTRIRCDLVLPYGDCWRQGLAQWRVGFVKLTEDDTTDLGVIFTDISILHPLDILTEVPSGATHVRVYPGHARPDQPITFPVPELLSGKDLLPGIKVHKPRVPEAV
jgi:hypothetical protein